MSSRNSASCRSSNASLSRAKRAATRASSASSIALDVRSALPHYSVDLQTMPGTSSLQVRAFEALSGSCTTRFVLPSARRNAKTTVLEMSVSLSTLLASHTTTLHSYPTMSDVRS